MAKFFINRPIVSIVIALLMVIAGGITIFTLPTAQFPNITDPQVQVNAFYPGADSETIAQSVATPIAQQMAGVDGMNYMYSQSAGTGSMSLTVDFGIDTQADTDQILAQIRVAQANSQLPQTVVSNGLTVEKSSSSPLMLVDLYSPGGTYDSLFLANYATINLKDAISRVQGVASVSIFGAGDYAMRCWVNPDKLANLGITVPEIIDAIQSQNNVNPAGQIGGEPVPPGQQFTYTVRAPGRLPTAEEFGQIIVRAGTDGSILRLNQVARIELGAANYAVIGRMNGKPSAIISISQAVGSNAVQTAAGIRKVMEESKTRFPQDLDYAVALDTTAAVTSGIKEIERTLVEAMLLVIIVVFLFLQSWRATLIPLLAVPVSLIGTFIVFPLLGFSINTLSLFGMVLAIGLVVDDAIVVVEAVEHHIELGLSPHDATIKAMEQVSGPVIAIALILAAVFIPTAFIPGITGRLYQQFAVTIAISVLFSAFNALTLSPALSALLLRPKTESRGPLGAFFRWFNRMFGKITGHYVGISRQLIRKAFFALALLVAIAAGAGYMSKKVPTSFLPDEDQGFAFVALQLPEAASLQRTSEASREIEQILMHTPGVRYVSSVVGYSLLSGVTTTYGSFFFVTFKDWSERTAPDESYAAIKGHMAAALSRVTSGIAFDFPPPAIAGAGSSGGFTFVLEDRSGSPVEFLSKNTNIFMAAARKRPELAGVLTTALLAVPQLGVNVDTAKVMTQQIPLSSVYETLQTFMGGALINYFNRFGRQWQVWVQAEGNYRTSADNLGKFYVSNSNNQLTPLSTLTSIYPRSGPEFVMQFNQFQAVQIIGSAAPGYSSSQAIAALEEVFRETMPSQMGYDWTGMSYQEVKAAQGVSPVAIFALSFLIVFLIMAAQYESWTLPVSVLLGTPVAVLGAFLAIHLRQFDNNVYAQIGLVMLIGLSAKNAILIVEFAKEEFDRGASPEEAALSGAQLRLRPILMTAFAFILGCIPLWTAKGSGAISRQVLGTVVIGGMLASSLIAIFFIPVAFDVVERFGLLFTKKKPIK